MSTGIEIAHQYGKREMSRHSKDGARYTGHYPVAFYSALHQIHDILHAGKTQTSTAGIYDAVQFLVIIGVLTEQQPQHQQLGPLFRHSCLRKGQYPCRPSVGHSILAQRPYHSQHHAHGQGAVQQSFQQPFQGFGLFDILIPDITK